MEDPTNGALPIAIALILIVVNGFLVFAETAVVRARERRLEARIQSGSTQAADAAREAARELASVLAAAQLGTALAAVGVGWLGVGALADAIAFRLPPDLLFVGGGRFVAAFIAFVGFAGLYVIVGQLLPRRLGAQRAAAAASATAPALVAASRLLSPLAWVIDKAAKGLLRAAGAGAPDATPAEEEMAILSLKSRRLGLIGDVQRDILAAYFDRLEGTVKDAATARRDVASLSDSMRASEAFDAVRQFGFVRYPVFEAERDRAIGVVHYRDLSEAAESQPKVPVTDLMHPALSLPETTPLSQALKEMQMHRAHLAVVVNDFGSASGIVTIEDLLDAFLGDVGDKSSGQRARVVKVGPDAYELDGSLMVGQVEEAIGIDLHAAGVESIAAYIFGKLGRKPRVGDAVQVDDAIFDVVDVRGMRIRRLRVKKVKSVSAR